MEHTSNRLAVDSERIRSEDAPEFYREQVVFATVPSAQSVATDTLATVRVPAYAQECGRERLQPHC